MGWSRKEALKGEDPNKIRDVAAEIGTLAHALIEEYLGLTYETVEPKPVDRDEYTKADLKKANKSFQAYMEWEGKQEIEVLKSELQLPHPYLMYGGTIDMIATLDGELTLVDFKTGKNVYNDHVIQVAAYRRLMIDQDSYQEGGYPTDAPAIILHISKESGRFTAHDFTAKDLFAPWLVFQHCLEIRNLKGKMPI